MNKVGKPAYPVVSSSDSVTSISKSLKFTPTYSHSIDSSTSTFRVVSRGNIHRKRKLRKSSSFVNSAMILPTNLLRAETELMFWLSLEIIIYLHYFFYQHYIQIF